MNEANFCWLWGYFSKYRNRIASPDPARSFFGTSHVSLIIWICAGVKVVISLLFLSMVFFFCIGGE